MLIKSREFKLPKFSDCLAKAILRLISRRVGSSVFSWMSASEYRSNHRRITERRKRKSKGRPVSERMLQKEITQVVKLISPLLFHFIQNRGRNSATALRCVALQACIICTIDVQRCLPGRRLPSTRAIKNSKLASL